MTTKCVRCTNPIGNLSWAEKDGWVCERCHKKQVKARRRKNRAKKK